MFNVVFHAASSQDNVLFIDPVSMVLGEPWPERTSRAVWDNPAADVWYPAFQVRVNLPEQESGSEVRTASDAANTFIVLPTPKVFVDTSNGHNVPQTATAFYQLSMC
ncbi:MAG: hypothetical protein A4E63_00287 [Syntrophorhabdus sp. PtaU1.Bin050]|nr:MAG: hypothetical protein A4E63_00287 [Syntrophorhabdus sp. PtaU1.Bin050]